MAIKPTRMVLLAILGFVGYRNLSGFIWSDEAPSKQVARQLSGGHGGHEKTHIPGTTVIDGPADVAAIIEHAEHEHATEKLAPYVWVFCLVVMTGIVVAALLHNPCSPHIYHSFPESLIFIVVGIIISCLGELLMNDKKGGNEDEFLKFFETSNSVTLNLVLLPIIIFESGWSLNHKDFTHEFAWILIFAVGGTLISFFVTGSLIVLTGSVFHWHPIVTWRTALTYASLISAVDPVASLATYAALKVEPLLNITVFGESTINDAVAIALFLVFNGDNEKFESGNGWEIFVSVFVSCVWKLFGSIVLGFFVGCVVTLCFRCCEMSHSPGLETLMIFVSCFFMFCIAEAKPLELSGIITCLFGGIFLGMFARPHLSIEGSYLASYFLKQMATLADMCVFLFVGFSVLTFRFHGGYGFILGLLMIVFCMIARFLAIFPIGYLIVNPMKKCFAQDDADLHLLDFGRFFMMFWAGLRGGIALVLTMELGEFMNTDNGHAHVKHELRTCTFIVILFFLLAMGTTTEPLLKYFKIPMGSMVNENQLQVSTEFEAKWSGTVGTVSAVLIGTDRNEEFMAQSKELKGGDVYETLTTNAWGSKKVMLHNHKSLFNHREDFVQVGENVKKFFSGDSGRREDSDSDDERQGCAIS